MPPRSPTTVGMAVETTVISIAAIERLSNREMTVSGRLVFILGVDALPAVAARIIRRLPSGVPGLQQLLDERASVLRRYLQRPPGERPALGQHRLQLIQRGRVVLLVEEPDGDRVAPLAASFDGRVQVGGIVAHLLELPGPLLEEVARVLVVVGHAGAEDVDKSESPVLDGALDQRDEMLLL